MKEYKEQVDKLREKAERLYYDGWIDTPDAIMEAADTIEALCKSGWISVKDRLPEKRGEQFYLVALNEVATDFCQYFGEGHFGIIVKGKENICDEVTHWMPLPKPPKDNK